MYRHYKFGLCLLLVLPSILRGQDLHFKHYTQEAGISKIETHSPGRTLQDKEGFLWFATMDGLMRFDGLTFKQFRFSLRNTNSLGNNQTTAICQAKDGKIWIGTGSAGIYVFNPHTDFFEAIHHQAVDPDGLCGDGINFLATDQSGNIWVGTRFNGICKYISSENRFQSYPEFRDGRCFYQQEDGTIWLGSAEGLARYQPTQDNFRIYPIDPQQPDNRRANVIGDITEDALGQLWTTSQANGLHIFNPGSNRFKQLPTPVQAGVPNRPSAICTDQAGNIWISGFSRIYQYQVAEQKLSTFLNSPILVNSCPAGQITDLFTDKTGSIWLTVRGQGISVIHSPISPFEVISDFAIEHMEHLDSTTLLFSSPDGVQQFDTEKKTLQPFPLPPDFPTNAIGEIVFTPQQELWVVDYQTRTLHSWNSRTNISNAFPNKGIMFFTQDMEGTIWGSRDLIYYDAVADTWVDKHTPLVRRGLNDTLPRYVLDVEVDSNNRIWISSDMDGLRMYDPAKDTIVAYRYQKENPNSIASNIIYDLRPASDGRMYAGTIHGLSIVDTGQDTIINVTESEGLQHYQIQAIVEDNDTNIWLATKGGLSKVNTTDYSVQNYTHSDGLPEAGFVTYNSLRDKQGYLYFSTRLHGFRFHPDSLAIDTVTAPTYLMDFYLNQALVSPLDSNSILPSHIRYMERLQLNHRQTDFGFSFAMPIFKEAKQITYFYQLEGYDEEWQLTDNPQVHYTNIDPGDYTFRVKGQNRNGAWSTQEARLEILVLPPWWETKWAYVVFALFGIGTILWIYQYTLNRQLEQAEARQVKELDDLKTRFFTNITHEFRTPLTVMLGLNERNNNNRDRELIYRNGRKLLTLINQLLDLSKLDTGYLQPHYQQIEIVSFTQYIGESFQSLADKKYIRLMIYSEVEELWLDMDEEKYRQIISNLLSNAIKFTPESGKIIMHLNRLDDQLILKIKDNGAGIPEDELPHIFDRFYQVDNSSSRAGKGTGIGLAIVKKMVELMQGSIHVKSQPGKGTVVEVQFPIRLEAIERLDIFQPVLIEQSANQVVEWDTAKVANDQPRLLIIEDNPDLVIYLQSLLSTQYQLLLATDGEAGIQQAIETIPDIIISDVMMPKKNGFEVVETLKQDERSSHIPIILLTAKATQKDRIRGLKYGADAYLMKPFDKEELFIRLQKLIEVRLNLQQKYNTYTPASETSEDPNERFLQKIKELVHERLSEPDFNVERLTELLNISHTQFYRKLKALTDQTPSQYIRSVRLQEAQHLLRTTDLNISEIAYKVGFNDPSYFTRLFSKEFGQPPIEFRK